MAERTLLLAHEIDGRRFPAHVLKEYYDAAREIMTAILILDGYKVSGEGAHQQLIEHLRRNQAISREHAELLKSMRIIRNRALYEGESVPAEYLARKRHDIERCIANLRTILETLLSKSGKVAQPPFPK